MLIQLATFDRHARKETRCEPVTRTGTPVKEYHGLFEAMPEKKAWLKFGPDSRID